MRKLALTLTLAFGALSAASAQAYPVYRSSCIEGASYPLAAANAQGQVLVAWQQGQREGASCHSASADVAIGSMSTGFLSMGAIPAKGLSYPTAAFLDQAGDGWVVGVHQRPVAGKYEVEYVRQGSWYAFRPAGGPFRPAVELAGDAARGTPKVAGNATGSVVLAWQRSNGTQLAWGNASGAISKPVFYSGFQFSGIGVDDAGRALIVGDYPAPGARASAIVQIAGRAGAFSRPRILATAPRSHRRRGVLGQPLLAMGPNGQALIAWESLSREGASTSRDMLVYRRANGRLDRPVALATNFLQGSIPLEEASRAAVDGAGRGLILTGDRAGLRAAAVSADGRPGRIRRLATGNIQDPTLAANPSGATIATWAQPRAAGGIAFTLGQAQELGVEPHSIESAPGTSDGMPTAVVDGRGVATLVWVRGQAGAPDTLTAGTGSPGGPILQIAP
jgi:hypothetical protein